MSSFPYAGKEIARLRSMEDQVLGHWLSGTIIQNLFHKYGMDESYFKEHYAFALYRSFVDIAKGIKSVESCPMVHTLIDYFKNRDMTLSDLNQFFAAYRKSVLKHLLQQGNVDIELFDEVQHILDHHFQDALNYYNASFFSKDQALKSDLIRFREYQKAIDKSAIVSKADPNGVITYVNQAFCHTTGYAYEEMIGQSHSLIRHPDTGSEFFAELWDAIGAKKVFHATIKNRKKSGESYYVDATIVPILDEDNAVIEYIAMSYDVTALIQSLETAKKAQQVKDEFLANMSHEIRTPLNAIMGFVAILRKQISDSKNSRYIDVIHSSSQMLMDMVNDILDLSKMQSGKFIIHTAPYNPLLELSNTVALFGSKADEKSIRYAVYIDPNLPECLSGDGARVKQILSNFLSNAIKFTPKNGSVKVKAVYEKGELRVSVQDTGIGVGSDKQAKIFEAFEQADSSITRNFGGTGLGLSICVQLVSQMNGKLVFKSVENKGSLFGFHLPCEPCDETIDDTVRYPFASLKIAVCSGAEDAEMTALLEKYLKAFGITSVKYIEEAVEEGYDMIFCPAGSDQLNQLAASPIRTVLLHKNSQQTYPEFTNCEQLREPLLPTDIAAVLESAAQTRNAV